MLKAREQKIKLLILYDVLCRLTDENNALNTDEIIEELAKRNISVARKVLPLDIALLNKNGYEVFSYKKKYYYYYVANRKFDTAEVKMLTDVVKASKLSNSKKCQLINKIAQTMSSHQAAHLLKNLISFDAPKRSNGSIIYSIDAIDRAISEKKKVSFQYFTLDEKKNKVFRKDGQRYITNPLVMVWNKDNYYLLAYSDNHLGITTYRIDRMKNVEVEERERVEKAEFKNFNIEKYRAQVFSMFGGRLEEVEIEFERDLLDGIFDKFGEEIQIIKLDDEHFRVKVPIQISSNFFSWIIGSKGKTKIVSPENVHKEFISFIEDIKKNY